MKKETDNIKLKMQQIPSVHSLLEHFHGKSGLDWEFLKKIVQTSVDEIKHSILSEEMNPKKNMASIPEAIKNRIRENIQKNQSASLKRVINATGIILHTGLGRAPLSDIARKNVETVITDYCNLEFDLETGERGERLDHLEPLLQLLTGAEAGLVVNNNAAAVLLMLNTFGKNKDVIISRGELVEIGGSFRMPEVMEISGARLKEVGATNRTHLKDYLSAIDEQTSMILKVHPSNFRIKGFSKEVDIPDLKNIAVEKNLLLAYDLGGGALIDLTTQGLPPEPVISKLVDKQVDIITFSGDKLMGGPQAGIIVGKRELIRKMHKNPLYRALRVDKVTIALLEATLKTFLFKDLHQNELYKKQAISLNGLRKIGRSILRGISSADKNSIHLKVVDAPVQIGSGALPVEDLSSVAIRFQVKGYSAENVARFFRRCSIPVVGYIQGEAYFWNLRTIRSTDIGYLKEQLKLFMSELPSKINESQG